MTLDQLRVFVAVAERQHVTRAARALNLAQSAVSHAIAALEDALGVRLFNRVGRGIELTEAGHLFLAEARAVLARAEAARLRLSELAGLERGVLLVAASQTIAGYWLPGRLMAFRARHPRIEIRLSIGNTVEVLRQVHEGGAEIGLVEGAACDPALRSVVVAQDRLVLVVSRDHPWAGRTALRPEELTEVDWILREPGSGTRSEFEAAAGRLGVAPHALRVVLELPSNEAVRAAVEAGPAATVIPASVAAPGLEAGLLHRVPLDLPQRGFRLVRHRERYLSRSAGAFLSLLGVS